MARVVTGLEDFLDEQRVPHETAVDTSSKWVAVESPDCQAASVAYRALGARLRHVARLLPLAALEHESDVEHVHQLRVGCRRAAAAVRAFRPLMKRKPRRLNKWLRKIRQAAGPARDADVLLEHLKQSGSSGASFDDLLARVERERDDAQPALVKVNAAAATGKFKKHIDACLESLCPERGAAMSFRALATPALKDATERLMQRSQETSVGQLHQLRIAGKRLRYSIELFHGAFDPALRDEIYPQIKSLQTRLGTLNDRAATQLRFQRWLTELPADDRAACLAERIVAEHQSAKVVRQEFLAWWTEARVAELDQRLRMLLSS